MDAARTAGRHNRRNALIARRCLAALGVPGAADDDDGCAPPPHGYQPLPSRLTPVGTVDGVTFVDDCLSTNVLPTLAALDSFPGRRIALIVGGHDRGIDYAPLAAGVADRAAPTCVLTLPDSGPRIHAEIDTAPAAGHRQSADCPAWTPRSRRRSGGPGPTASSCSPRPRPASASSATTATAAAFAQAMRALSQPR